MRDKRDKRDNGPSPRLMEALLNRLLPLRTALPIPGSHSLNLTVERRIERRASIRNLNTRVRRINRTQSNVDGEHQRFRDKRHILHAPDRCIEYGVDPNRPMRAMLNREYRTLHVLTGPGVHELRIPVRSRPAALSF